MPAFDPNNIFAHDIARVLDIQKERAMEPLNNIDMESKFAASFDGFLANLDKDREDKKMNEFTQKKVNEVMQPKVINDEGKITLGNKLPLIKNVDPVSGANYKHFFETYFQTVKENVINLDGKVPAAQ